MSEEDEDKDHAPTQKRLDEARRRGDVARSVDLTAALGMSGLVLVSLGAAALLVGRAAGAAQGFLTLADQPVGRAGDPSAAAILHRIGPMLTPLLPFLLVPALFALVALIGQRSITFAPEKLAPKLSRVSPLANARQKFGATGLFEFGKSAAKLALTAVLTFWFIGRDLPYLIPAMAMPASAVAALLMETLVRFLLFIAAMAVLLGGLDYVWQWFDHLRRNRMSRQELMDEFRESEGDPHIKGQRRQRAEAIAMNRMMADVPKADVVIVNPTHYAVALRWNRKSGRAPVCLAKGVDEVAARIRAAAALAGVPVRSDPPTARILYATVDLGAEIRREHFGPVAAAIRYAENMRRRARERGR